MLLSPSPSGAVFPAVVEKAIRFPDGAWILARPPLTGKSRDLFLDLQLDSNGLFLQASSINTFTLSLIKVKCLIILFTLTP